VSHPIDFVEGSGSCASTIRRCEHGVYRPTYSADSDPNPVCSICQMPLTTKETTKQYRKLKAKNSRLTEVAAEIEEEKDVEELQTHEEGFTAQAEGEYASVERDGYQLA
jgi:hypothetical protein